MQNEPNQQPTPEPEQPTPAQPEQPAATQPEQPTAAPVQPQTPPAPVQSPTQPAPNAGQPADLSAQKLLDDYEKDRDRHDIGKIMVIGCIFMLLGGISLVPVITWLFLAGPGVLIMLAGSPMYLGNIIVAATAALVGLAIVFRKEIGRVGARIVAVLQLIFIAINFVSQLGGIAAGAALASSSPIGGSYIGVLLLGIISVVFYVWVFRFMGKQSVRNLFRP